MTKIEWDRRLNRLAATRGVPASMYRHPSWLDDAMQEQLLQTLEQKYPIGDLAPSMQGILPTPQLTPSYASGVPSLDVGMEEAPRLPFPSQAPPLDELRRVSPASVGIPDVDRTVQDMEPGKFPPLQFPSQAPPIDELRFTSTSPVAARDLPAVDDIEPLERLVPLRDDSVGIKFADSLLGEDRSAATVGVGPLISRSDEEKIVYPEDGATNMVGELEMRDSEAIEDTEEDAQAGEDFNSRLANLGDMSSIFQYPSVQFMDPRIMDRRQRLQKRRNFLRALYKMPPKDIVWPSDSGGESNTDMINRWKMQRKRAAELAYAQTLPQNEAQVMDLSNALGGGYLKELLALHKQARPDYDFENKRLTALEAANVYNQKLAADALFIDVIKEDGTIDYDKLEQGKARIIKEARGGDDFVKRFDAHIALIGEKALNLKQYTIPWRWKPTENNRELLELLGISEGGYDGYRKFKDQDFWYITPDAAHTVRQFDLNNPDDVALLGRLQRANLPGFGVYDTVSSPAQYMSMVDENLRLVPGPLFDSRNASLMDWASFKGREMGWTHTTDDNATRIATQADSARSDITYQRAQRSKTQANSVVGIVEALLNAHQRIIQDARANGETEQDKFGNVVVKYEPIFGGIAGLKMSFQNFKELGRDINRATGWNLFGVGVNDAQASLALARNSLNFLNDHIANAQEYPPDITAGQRELYDKDVEQLSVDAGIWRSNLEAVEREVAKGPGTEDAAVWQGRIATKLLSTALATLVARLYSSTDRLLKQQYTDYRNQLELHKLSMSETKALVTLGIIGALAKSKIRDANVLLGDYAPSTYRREPKSGLYTSTVSGVSEAQRIANEAIKEAEGL